jgi:hypothetical protein
MQGPPAPLGLDDVLVEEALYARAPHSAAVAPVVHDEPIVPGEGRCSAIVAASRLQQSEAESASLRLRFQDRAGAVGSRSGRRK